MIIRGKEIKPENITMWLNIFSFVIGILFYFRIERNTEHPTEAIPVQNALHDSSLLVNARLEASLHEIRIVQDSLLRQIQARQTQLETQKPQVAVIRQRVLSTIHNDWDSLSPQAQDAYVNQIMSNLKPNK